MQFSAKILPKNWFLPQTQGLVGLVPPCLGNPGLTTVVLQHIKINTMLPMLAQDVFTETIKKLPPVGLNLRFKGNPYRESKLPLPLEYIVMLGNGSGTDFKTSPHHHRPSIGR